MRCPFAGDGHHVSHKDIVEGVPRWNDRYAYVDHQHNFLFANEEIEEEEEEEYEELLVLF